METKDTMETREKMETIKYKIKLYGYWHVGGKDGANPQLDNAVLKDKNNNPYIGGKTLKGLIKDAAVFISQYRPDLVSAEFIERVFGVADGKPLKSDAIPNKFNNATLEQTIPDNLTHLLYHHKTSTALEQNKKAKEHSLRATEVCVPLELTATIENVNTSDVKAMNYCIKGVKMLGENRFRGIGRCEFVLLEPKIDE